MEPDHTINTDDMGVSRGITWGVLLSTPLWLSFFGWLKLITQLLTH